ncbi:PQQ-binding-like beta-propeller repeat protein [Deinococcus arenicola]|uniref:PQQ-binding-like beta-propeller repeat protein n=1 Tax=Deinococcus arenicola TaxID=2994950 RepID=A0ABU4DUR4_9DEIO|nr:PQQ-binding-like beta-propeller repeat protein [Deinococcus sp. ZS9-10]MDV6376179.1 PQQ-binding-like beta-propeller repeat protein [Deinococcus sp. ZS9-10]
MRPLLSTLLLIAALTSCDSTSTSTLPGSGPALPSLTRLWSLPKPTTLGQTTLVDNLMLGSTPNLTAIDVQAHRVAFTIPLKIDYGRTTITSLGDHLVALTGAGQDSLTVLSRTGQVLNTFKLLAGTGIGLNSLGPVVVGTSLYVVSGISLYKFNTADLLRPDAQPMWVRTYTGLALSSLLVADEDHIVVAVNNADVSRQLVALDGQGQQRWALDVAPSTQVASSAYILNSYKDLVIAHAGSAGLQAYKLSTGARAWDVFPNTDICPGGHAIQSFNLTIAADKIFMGPWGGTCVLAYHADNGKLAWVFDAPNNITFDTKPLYLNGVVYASNSRLWALDAETGKPLAQATDDLNDNTGTPLAFDPIQNQILHWGLSGIFAYRPLK